MGSIPIWSFMRGQYGDMTYRLTWNVQLNRPSPSPVEHAVDAARRACAGAATGQFGQHLPRTVLQLRSTGANEICRIVAETKVAVSILPLPEQLARLGRGDSQIRSLRSREVDVLRIAFEPWFCLFRHR